MKQMGEVPVFQAEQYIIDQGYPANDVIEHMDYFHPSQMGVSFMGQDLFDKLVAEFPEAVGPENLYNKEIASLFGDQGGY